MKTNVDRHFPEFRHFGDRDAAASCDVVLRSDRCSGFRPGLRVWVVPDVPGVSTGVLAADGKFRNARGCVSGDGAMKKMSRLADNCCLSFDVQACERKSKLKKSYVHKLN